MKLIISILSVLLLLLFSNYTIKSNDECEVINFYEYVRSDHDIKALSNGNIYDVDLLLKDYDFDDGVYNIEVSSISDNLYSIDNTEYYIETRNCYNDTYHDEAVLKVEFSDDPILYFNINNIN
jgi:hypothetical protein